MTEPAGLGLEGFSVEKFVLVVRPVFPVATVLEVPVCVVVGGGIALLVAQHKVKGGVTDKSASFLMGFNTVVNSLHSPFVTILQNAGVPSTHYTSMKTKFVTEKHMGYNANTDTIENIFEAGVIDPAAVTIAAVQSAAKVAGILLTTSVVIVNEGTDE